MIFGEPGDNKTAKSANGEIVGNGIKKNGERGLAIEFKKIGKKKSGENNFANRDTDRDKNKKLRILSGFLFFHFG